jgi:hypothetical protein
MNGPTPPKPYDFCSQQDPGIAIFPGRTASWLLSYLPSISVATTPANVSLLLWPSQTVHPAASRWLTYRLAIGVPPINRIWVPTPMENR